MLRPRVMGQRPAKSGRLLPPALLLAAAMLLGACAWQPDGVTEPPKPLSMFDDIPLARKLTLDEKDSLVREHEFGRIGLMKTSGFISRDDALNYYRAAMAENGWIKDSEFDNGVSLMMIFSNPPRSAAITVTEGWFFTDVEINVSVNPQ